MRWRARRDSNVWPPSSEQHSGYAANLGIVASTNRKNRVLRAPATETASLVMTLDARGVPRTADLLRGRDLNLRLHGQKSAATTANAVAECRFHTTEPLRRAAYRIAYPTIAHRKVSTVLSGSHRLSGKETCRPPPLRSKTPSRGRRAANPCQQMAFRMFTHSLPDTGERHR